MSLVERPIGMLERVAEALKRNSSFCTMAEDAGVGDEMFDRYAKEISRAAIEAMREPADDQRNAYYELSGRTEVMMDSHWERAIDAALSTLTVGGET